MKRGKIVNEFMYLMLNITDVTYVICTGSTCASMCNTMLQQLHEMPNLSHTCSTLGMDQFIELFEWYLEFKDY